MHNKKRLLFVINPISGGKEKKDLKPAIKKYCSQVEAEHEFITQTGENDKAALEIAISEFQPDIVVAIGGDGTVKMVAEVIKGTTVTLGIVPGGSANGLAKELGIEEDLDKALEIIMNGERKQLDAIKINDKELCFHLSDAGLNALLVKYFEQSNTRGMWGYVRSIFKMLWNKRRLKVTIKTDEETILRSAYMIVIANAEKYGTGAVINPHGSVLDGSFEVVVVRQLHLIEVFKAVMAHRNFDPKKIEVFRTKQAEISFRRPVNFQVDGEYLGKIQQIKAQILPKAVYVMMPQKS